MSDAGVEAFAKAYYESGYAAATFDALKVTDEQVAAAAKAYWLAPDRATAAEAMRAALEAARAVRSTPGNGENDHE